MGHVCGANLPNGAVARLVKPVQVAERHSRRLVHQLDSDGGRMTGHRSSEHPGVRGVRGPASRCPNQLPDLELAEVGHVDVVAPASRGVPTEAAWIQHIVERVPSVGRPA